MEAMVAVTKGTKYQETKGWICLIEAGVSKEKKKKKFQKWERRCNEKIEKTPEEKWTLWKEATDESETMETEQAIEVLLF